jgi:hypothetical protein
MAAGLIISLYAMNPSASGELNYPRKEDKAF